MQISVRREAEEVKHLVEHGRVLPRRQYPHVKIFLFHQRDNDGSHLDCLGSRPDNAYDLFLIHYGASLSVKRS
ncbi:hypothetical protein SDC9_155723 [bioreactor metagenome]|uniref:Uncharacterized protein n=1 Tax=bioreactor metagenome TaxID=1076179 RepID=A0A645F2F9_9ZZZZ